MKPTIDSLTRDYRAAFLRYLAHREEDPLHAAYDLGRRALAAGFNLPDVVQMHHAILLEAFVSASGEPEMNTVASRGGEFLAEARIPVRHPGVSPWPHT